MLQSGSKLPRVGATRKKKKAMKIKANVKICFVKRQIANWQYLIEPISID
jgi:hypothetical protein